MKLYYRSLSYEYNSSDTTNRKTEKPFQSVRPIGSAYNLIYRGMTYHVNPNVKLDKVTAPLVTNKLVYRGIVYTVNKTVVGDICVASQPVSTRKNKHSNLSSRIGTA